MAKVMWTCTSATFDRYRHLLQQYEQVDPWSEAAYVIRDELLLLPGFPNNLNPHTDVLVPVLQTRPMSVIMPATALAR